VQKMIVYLSGYGRSGSTLLDIILGSSHNAVSAGEVGNLLELYLDPGGRCSCDKKLNECTVWSEVVERAFPGSSPEVLRFYNRIQQRVEKWTNLHLLLLPKRQISLKCTYAMFMRRLWTSVFAVSGKSVIVDSSKSAYRFAWRALALHRLCKFDVRVIHLVRDGRGVMQSKIRGNDRKLRAGVPAKERFAAYRGLAGWVIANCISIITRFLLPTGLYQLVRYEDLVSKPEVELKKLGHFLQLDLSDHIRRIKADELFSVGHLVAGNRLATQNKVGIQSDSGASANLATHLKVIYYLFGWPILAYLWIVRLSNDGSFGKA